jgi:hypothetical protein
MNECPEIELITVRKGFDPQSDTNWVVPTATSIDGGDQNIIISARMCELTKGTRCDIFTSPYHWGSRDGGRSWSEQPEPETGLENIIENDWKLVFSGNAKWHAHSEKCLNIGHYIGYKNNSRAYRPCNLRYSVFDKEQFRWGPLKEIDGLDLAVSYYYNGGMQRVELENGDILLPVYAEKTTPGHYCSFVARCSFDGKAFRVRATGTVFEINVERGFCEPSVIRCNGEFFITLRNDVRGYVARSPDGLNYSSPQPWLFDDGSELGSYNTQQHFVTAADRLFLIYTRRGANNEHMAFVRHRAPLFMAEVDMKSLRVIRSSERIVIPDRGARCGNFDILQLNDHETWIVEAEWMEEREELISRNYGSDNSIFIVRLKWCSVS